MSYLSREAANLPEALWTGIDSAVVATARGALTGRRFLSVFGPLGVGTGYVPVDDAQELSEVDAGGIITTTGRKYVEIPTLYEDFTLLAKDLEGAAKAGYPADLSKAVEAHNEAVRSIETRLMPSFRRFRDLGVSTSREMPEAMDEIRVTARETIAGVEANEKEGEKV